MIAVDLGRHCGVIIQSSGLSCTRSLICKSHSLASKRAVTGRPADFDELYANYIRSHAPKLNSDSNTATDQSWQIQDETGLGSLISPIPSSSGVQPPKNPKKKRKTDCAESTQSEPKKANPLRIGLGAAVMKAIERNGNKIKGSKDGSTAFLDLLKVFSPTPLTHSNHTMPSLFWMNRTLQGCFQVGGIASAHPSQSHIQSSVPPTTVSPTTSTQHNTQSVQTVNPQTQQQITQSQYGVSNVPGGYAQNPALQYIPNHIYAQQQSMHPQMQHYMQQQAMMMHQQQQMMSHSMAFIPSQNATTPGFYAGQFNRAPNTAPVIGPPPSTYHVPGQPQPPQKPQ